MHLEDRDKLQLIIESIMVNNSFSSCDYTVRQKNIMCQAYLELLDSDPQMMVNYCLKDIRGNKVQNKIFKTYISLLEKSLPLMYVKGKTKYVISNIADPDLNIFEDPVTFEGEVDKNGKVKNNTTKMYIGGRKASYVKPYYIGKLLGVKNLVNGASLLSKVSDYNFSYIKLDDVNAGTLVSVSHLPVPPHYQMGAMVYLNRIKQEIKKLK